MKTQHLVKKVTKAIKGPYGWAVNDWEMLGKITIKTSGSIPQTHEVLNALEEYGLISGPLCHFETHTNGIYLHNGLFLHEPIIVANLKSEPLFTLEYQGGDWGHWSRLEMVSSALVN